MQSENENVVVIDETQEVFLEELGLSTRLFNCLKRSGYNTLSDVMNESMDQLLKIRYLGEKTRAELEELRRDAASTPCDDTLQHAKNNNPDCTDGNTIKTKQNISLSVLEVAINHKLEKPIIYFCDNGVYSNDISIKDLNLSNRTVHVLLTHQLNTLKQVALMPYDTLLHLRGMGHKGSNELLYVLRTKTLFMEKNTNDESNTVGVIEKTIDFFKPLLPGVDLSAHYDLLSEEILNAYNEENDGQLSIDVVNDIACQFPIKVYLQRKIMEFVPGEVYRGISQKTLVSVVTGDNKCFVPIVDSTIDNMIEEGSVRSINGNLCKNKAFLAEWIDTLGNRDRIVITRKCDGKTLEEIGDELNLTRERVRQILSKVLRRRPKLYEDDYAKYVKQYGFLKQEFCDLFELTKPQVNYLFLTQEGGKGKGSKDINDLLYDTSVPEYVKDNIPVVFKTKFIIIDGECVPIKREQIINKVLQLFYNEEECGFEDFEQSYLSFLKEHQIDRNEELLFPSSRAFEARLGDSKYALIKAGRRIRYYDTTSIDINALLKEVNIDLYNDMEISTLKLFREYQETMEKYDIRDEYELHNLIRKNADAISDYSISVNRMPTLVIGNGDRTRQVEDLLLQMAPVTNVDLANEYEKLYGVRADTVLANYFKEIDVYFHDGLFDLRQQDLTEDMYEKLGTILADDFYLLKTIEKKYREISKESNTNAINAMTLKKLGFKVFSQYVIRASYPSAESFFEKMLMSNQSLNINDLPFGIKEIQSFNSVISALRDSLQLIEVGKDLYYRYDYFAQKYTINNREELIALRSSILSRIDDLEYFSINSILNSNIIKEYPTYINNPFVVNSLIRSHPDFKTVKLGSSFVGAKKDNDLSYFGLITHAIALNGEMSITQLEEYLLSSYTVRVSRAKILYLLEKTNEYGYDPVFDYVGFGTQNYDLSAPLFLAESRYSKIITEHKVQIESSNISITRVYWEDLYAGFVDYCIEKELYLMKDILDLDFNELYVNSSRANLSRGRINQVVNKYIEWVSSMQPEQPNNTNEEDILDLFFK